jgi:hypothetical protein
MRTSKSEPVYGRGVGSVDNCFNSGNILRQVKVAFHFNGHIVRLVALMGLRILEFTLSLKVMTALLAHCANAEAIAAESSAFPFDDLYFDGMTQLLLRGIAPDNREQYLKVHQREEEEEGLLEDHGD